jgi:endo-beta-N-acetylglucosaminidase D
VRPSFLANKLYSCNYLRYIDTFVYFSHKLVCVPPPTWSNTLHRNGVKVLGTFLIERHTPHIEKILEQKNGSFTVAKQLAAMAHAYGFDGWLLNIEGAFPNHTEDYLKRLTGFISSLKSLLRPVDKVVWYDALTCDNKVVYQNSMTPKNVVFALAADALFTNYKWTIPKVEEARKLAMKQGLETEAIIFGVDVWAQNTNMSGPPRITFPLEGGGGTNTGVVSDLHVV